MSQKRKSEQKRDTKRGKAFFPLLTADRKDACSFFCLMLMLCIKGRLISQIPENKLEQIIRTNSYAGSAHEALTEALKLNRKDLLLIGMDNPDLWVKEQSAELLYKFPGQNPDEALIAILQRESLWVEEMIGGRNIVTQQKFVASIKKMVSESLKIDTSRMDFFDAKTRTDLVLKLKQK